MRSSQTRLASLTRACENPLPGCPKNALLADERREQ
jgi:hypothetical protein